MAPNEPSHERWRKDSTDDDLRAPIFFDVTCGTIRLHICRDLAGYVLILRRQKEDGNREHHELSIDVGRIRGTS